MFEGVFADTCSNKISPVSKGASMGSSVHRPRSEDPPWSKQKLLKCLPILM
jgi:hypothetical protein